MVIKFKTFFNCGNGICSLGLLWLTAVRLIELVVHSFHRKLSNVRLFDFCYSVIILWAENLLHSLRPMSHVQFYRTILSRNNVA